MGLDYPGHPVLARKCGINSCRALALMKSIKPDGT